MYLMVAGLLAKLLENPKCFIWTQLRHRHGL